MHNVRSAPVFRAVLYADCHNVVESKAAVATARPDTPEDQGEFGVGTRRHAYMGYGGSPDYVKVLQDVVVMLMIEKKGAVEELEEILALPGLDMVQWGGSDYSISVGKASQRTSYIR